MNRNRGGGSGGFRSGGRGGSSRSGGRFGGSFRKNNFNSGPREMHKAICSDRKQECEVPFKPTEGKPVYCKNCYANHKKF